MFFYPGFYLVFCIFFFLSEWIFSVIETYSKVTIMQAEVAEMAEVTVNMNMRVEDSTNIPKLPKPRNKSGSSECPRSNHSSLIITYEDGSTEENDCVVTSLGFSHVDSDALTIVEIGQKNKVRSVSYEETRMNSPEIVTVDDHIDPDYEAVHLPTVMRDHSPLLEIETLPNSPSPCLGKMSCLSISPPPPQSPSIGDCGGWGDMLRYDILSKHGDGELGSVFISRRGE